MSSYGLKLYNPQETVGQWTECCKVHHTCMKKQITTPNFVFVGGFGNEAELLHCLFISSAKIRSERTMLSLRVEKVWRIRGK